MKRILSLIVVVLALKVTAWAQPTISFSSHTPCTEGGGSTQFCMDATVKDFTDILSMEFTVKWDSSVIRLDQVTGFGLPSLSASNFDLTKKANGYVTLKWKFNDCTPNAVGVTLPDGRAIFKLCFTAISTYGASTEVEITNTPVDIKVTRVNACPNNIGLFAKNGVVSTCVRPLQFIASEEEANPGDLVCVDVKVKGFDDMTSMQFSMNWDSTVLQFEDVVVLNSLVNLSRSGFGTPDDPDISSGVLTVSWAYVDPNDRSGVDLPDSTSIFQVCFRVIGKCETSSVVSISSDPTPIEVTNTVKEGFELKVLTTDGKVQVADCDPQGLKLLVDCGPEVNLNDNVCVKVSTQGFKNILEVEHLLEWNPNILEFKEVRIPSPNPLLGLGVNDFKTTNVGNGILALEYATVANIAQNLNDNTVLYEVCFTVVGLGANSPVRIPVRPATVRTTTTRNIGVNPTNCEVKVTQPAGVTLTMSDEEGAPGDTVCVDFSVANFKDIVNLQFSLAWDTAHVTFLETRDIKLSGATNANFGTTGINGGSLTFEWLNTQAQTLADNTNIFTVCFVVTGTPKDCQIIEMVDLPLARVAKSADSNDNNIGLVGQGGEICALNPEGYTLIMPEEEGFIGDTICLPFRVSEFNGITSTSFTINWSPTVMSFVQVKPGTGLNLNLASNFDATSANVGALGFNFQNAAGATVADTTVIFEVCVSLLGPKNECHDIVLNPVRAVSTVRGEGSVQFQPGKVCINDRLVIENIKIKPVSCPNASDGEVELTVSGGTGQIFFNWGSTPVQFSNKARNLAIGKIEVTIFDSNRPALVLKDTFDVPLTTQLPTANAGRDRFATCDPDVFLLNGTGSTGPNYSYQWSTVGGTLPGDRESLISVGSGAGLYILTVRDKQTQCATADTVKILAPPVPVSNAGTDLSFDCSRDTLTLDGSRSSRADTVAYAWRVLSGNGKIVAGDSAKVNPRITAPGTYLLRTYFTKTRCSAFDTVVVKDIRQFPNANAGDDVELGCTDDFVLLDGAGSVNEGTVSYKWKTDKGEELAQGVSYQAPKVGSYVLEVTNPQTGCISTDTVKVVASGQFPTVNVGGDLLLTCASDTLAVSAEVGNVTKYTLQWMVPQGGQIVAGTETTLTPKITAPGVYELVVTNSDNQCSTSDSLVVTEDRALPTAEAGQGGQLTCTNKSFTLDGNGTSRGAEFSYTWKLGSNQVALDTLKVAVTAAGTYLLEVINRSNGCTATDTVAVISDANAPQITITPATALSCRESTVTLSATVTPANARYQIQWAPKGAGNISGGGTTLSPQVNAAGTYSITITNPDNGCVGTGEVAVTANKQLPLAKAGEDRALTCRDTVATLDGSTSSTGQSITYQWSATGGGTPPTNATTSKASTRTAGTYVLLVTDSNNGCTAQDTVKVTSNTTLPQVTIATPSLLSCTQKSVEINATGSPSGANFSTTWTGSNGQTVTPGSNPLVATVTQAGVYQLVIRDNTTGCEGKATVEVKSDASIPTAVAGGDQILPCPGQALTLNGSGSSSGAGITYLWTVVSGSGTITNATSASASVNQPGTYQIEVRNTANGCNSTAKAVVTLDPVLVPADAGEDLSVCDTKGDLMAVLPSGATGRWTNSSGAKIESPTQSATFASNLASGDNVFTWTLSRANCPNYSSDEVIIRKEVAPDANNDVATVPVGRRELEINLAGNDQPNTSGEWSVQVKTQPTLGKVDRVSNGKGTYIPKPGVFGQDEFTYELCNVSCPELCDTAFVQVKIDFDENYKPKLPNTITPNGDGLNDELSFEILENAVDFWPDNELIIFNRWGDIVYQAKPYNNDWRGTTDTGLELPDGTYYYVLRLDIPNGVIYKGDITILK